MRPSEVWRKHWKLSGDPFPGAGSPFVRTPTHAEALARLEATLEGNQRLAVLRGAEGLGKSAVLDALIRGARGPKRRIARVNGPVEGTEMFAGLASGLGKRLAGRLDRGAAWKALADAVRLCRWQKQHVVLVVDDAQTLESRADHRDLERLARFDIGPGAEVSVIVSLRDDADGESIALGSTDWLPAIRLLALTRSETLQYAGEKLIAAGRKSPAFTPAALARLHDMTEGVPRGIDRLASLALMVGASRGLELVTPDVIDAAARECVRVDPHDRTAA